MPLTTETSTVPTADGPMPVFTAIPADPARGAVVVVQEAFGVTTHIQSIAERLAGAGWHAVAPALFHRQGSPVLSYDDLEKVMPIMQQVTAEGLTADLTACFDHLEARGFPVARTGIVGFCMGGTVAFFGGTLRPLGAAVTFYGGGVGEGRFGLPSLIDLAPSLQAPWLGLYGDLDQGIPTADVERLRQATAASPAASEVVRYSDAEHGFNCNDRPSAYNPAAAADAWQRTLAWFDQHITG
ncbi:MAG: dienelactone hydrolase family protein [Acidimicrobiales bacterium]